MITAPGQAHFPALFAKEFVRSEPAPQGDHTPSPEVPSAPMDKADADTYKQKLEEQELIGGPYAQGLIEPLSSLGHYQMDRGYYLEAEDLYKRALHILRVNDGLNSEHQIPAVNDLLNLYRTAGDLASLDDRYDYLFRLYGNGWPPYTPERRKGVLEYLRWQRAAHCSGIDRGNIKRLVDLFQLNKRILELVAQTPNEDPAWKHELVLSQIRNLYLLLGSHDSPSSGFSVRSASQIEQPSLVQQKWSYLLSTGFNNGRDLLQSLIAVSAQLEPTQRAALHLELGDWYQWNERGVKADEEYVIVEEILLEAVETDLLDQWLGEPVELPDNDAFRQPDLPSSDKNPVIVTVNYDISVKGHLSNIEVTTEKPEDSSVGQRIRRMLMNTHFRPRFVSGHAEPMENLTRQYQLAQ